MELDQIIEYAVAKGYVAEDILFPSEAFQPGFLEMLCHDKEILKQLNAELGERKSRPEIRPFRPAATKRTAGYKKSIRPANWYCSQKAWIPSHTYMAALPKSLEEKMYLW